MNQRKYLLTRISIYTSLLFLTFLSSVDVVSSRLIGVFIVVIHVSNLIRLVKANILFSPLLFSDIFMASYGLYEMGLSLQNSGIQVGAKILIILCMFIWDIISASNKWTFMNSEESNLVFNIDFVKLKKIIYILFFIASVCMLYEWYKFGGIPALSENLELERFNISVNPLIHILAVMHRIIIVLSFVFLLKQKHNLFLKIIIIISFLFLLGLGARAEILYPILIATIIYYFSIYIKTQIIINTGLIAFIIIGVFPFFRKYISFGESYIHDLINISRYKSFYFLTPLYESFAYNFEIFGLNFESFPKLVPFGYGSYTILSNLPFLDIGKSITEIQNQLLGNNFYAGLASTYLGSVYADYGFFGSIVFTGFLAVIVNNLFKTFIRYRNVSTLILYSYIFYGVLMGFYHYVFDVVFIFYLIMIIMVLFYTKKRGFN